MADTIPVTCPECEKPMKVPATAAGKRIRCKSCGTTFPVKLASSGAKPMAAKAKSKTAEPPGKGDKAAAARKKALDDEFDDDEEGEFKPKRGPKRETWD